MRRSRAKLSALRPFRVIGASLSTGVLALIRVYRWCLSPLLGPRCRYLPSCSEYAEEALATHGLVSGGWMAIKRVGRCHPWARHGYDPVPALKDR